MGEMLVVTRNSYPSADSAYDTTDCYRLSDDEFKQGNRMYTEVDHAGALTIYKSNILVDFAGRVFLCLYAPGVWNNVRATRVPQ